MIAARGTRSRKRIINLGSDPGTFAVAAVSAFTCCKSLESNGSRSSLSRVRVHYLSHLIHTRSCLYIFALYYRVAYCVFMVRQFSRESSHRLFAKLALKSLTLPLSSARMRFKIQYIYRVIIQLTNFAKKYFQSRSINVCSFYLIICQKNENSCTVSIWILYKKFSSKFMLHLGKLGGPFPFFDV